MENEELYEIWSGGQCIARRTKREIKKKYHVKHVGTSIQSKTDKTVFIIRVK